MRNSFSSKIKILALALSVVMALTAFPWHGKTAHAVAGCINQHQVWDGDTISGIAAKYRVDPYELAAANGITNPRFIKIGDVLCLDGLVSAQPATGQPAQNPPPATGGPIVPVTPPTTPPLIGGGAQSVNLSGRTYTTDASGYYTVQHGDSLFRVGLAFGVTAAQLAAVNGIPNANLIVTGQRILVPPATPSAPVPGSIPAVSIQPDLAGPGDTVTVRGYNYPPNATVNLYLEKTSLNRKSNILTSVKTDANGTFTTSIVLPTAWPDGTPINTRTVSISGRSTDNVFWGMNFFINKAWLNAQPVG
ncbi:MAG: LysM peptidoglycan-binding domain-containing protein [Chloroflexi bacterium]|nr:LysM peptidoglycan-binding domain-containing protein [Chloroflexota bacterium]